MTERLISIPDSLYNGVQALRLKDYLGQRAKFLAVLDASADVESIKEDRI